MTSVLPEIRRDFRVPEVTDVNSEKLKRIAERPLTPEIEEIRERYLRSLPMTD